MKDVMCIGAKGIYYTGRCYVKSNTAILSLVRRDYIVHGELGHRV